MQSVPSTQCLLEPAHDRTQGPKLPHARSSPSMRVRRWGTGVAGDRAGDESAGADSRRFFFGGMKLQPRRQIAPEGLRADICAALDRTSGRHRTFRKTGTDPYVDRVGMRTTARSGHPWRETTNQRARIAGSRAQHHQGYPHKVRGEVAKDAGGCGRMNKSLADLMIRSPHRTLNNMVDDAAGTGNSPMAPTQRCLFTPFHHLRGGRE